MTIKSKYIFQFNEAKVKADFNVQVEEYLDKLSEMPELIDKLRLRCVELMDKWGEMGSDPIQRIRNMMGDERFLKFLKKTVPLTEPKVRDMGANTFVSYFFDLPFDNEAFIGKMAKDRGIPFT